MTTIINEFKAYLQHIGYGGGTVRMLPACVREFVEQQRITGIAQVEQAHVKAFYGWLHERPLKRRKGVLSEMMIRHYMYGLKTFFDWLETTGQSSYNPISGLKFRRAKQHVREPLSLTEVEQLFAAATLKERALLHVFYSCGLRRSEGEALNIQDIHFTQQLLYVRRGKGARRRVIPMTEKVSSQLQQYYLGERCSGVVKEERDQDAFMINRVGHRLKGDQCNDVLKSLVERSGIARPEVSLHHLRHSIATHLLQGGMSMEYVQDFLGHSHLETTQIYAKTDKRKISSL